MQNSPIKFLISDKPEIQILGHTRGGKVNKAKIVISPLERGFGYTLGHALRRILLSSMAGVAVTEVQIAGVKHEYDTLEGMQEDVLSLLLNLKEVAFILYKTSEVAEISLKKEGPGVVTAGDITLSQNMEIVDPQHVLAHLSEGGKLDIRMKVRKGCGYESAETRLSRVIEEEEEESTKVNTLHVDASYSPVTRVAYKVESARVKQQTDLDKLIIELETNGTLDPTAAIRRAMTLLYEQIKPLIDLESEEIISTQASQDEIADIYFEKVEKLELSARSSNCLQRAKIEYLGDLVTKTEAELMEQPNFGKRCLDEIKDCLTNIELELGTRLDSWPPKYLKRELELEEDETS